MVIVVKKSFFLEKMLVLCMIKITHTKFKFLSSIETVDRNLSARRCRANFIFLDRHIHQCHEQNKLTKAYVKVIIQPICLSASCFLLIELTEGIK